MINKTGYIRLISFAISFLGCLCFPLFISAQTVIPKDSSSITVADTVVQVDTLTVIQLDTLAEVGPVKIDTTAISEAKNIDEKTDKLFESRINEIRNEVNLTYNKRVRGFIDYFTSRNKNYLLVMERRRNLYFPIFEETLKRYNMPDEIKYLTIVESGLNPLAISRAGAAGLWQFMPGTGKEMGLIINEYIDERLDPYKSTEAACKYLSRIYKSFGDWELTLASYNCGPGAVKRAVRKSGKNDFWKSYDFLPAETRGYVPQYTAVTYVMHHLDKHNIFADSILHPMEFDTVRICDFVNLTILCEQLDICYDDFVKLNPAIRTNILPDNLNYPLRLPRDKILQFVLNKEEIMSCANVVSDPVEVETNDRRSKVNKTISVAFRQKLIHTVRSGEVLGKIAAKYGVGVSQIKSWNNINGNTIRIGQKLIVYKTKYSAVQKSYSTAATRATSSSYKPKAKYYYVQPGDTLWTISKKNGGVSVEKIKKLNNIKGSKIKVGQKLIIS